MNYRNLIQSLIYCLLFTIFTNCNNPDIKSKSESSKIVSKKDILILISYSGKTSELKNIIQYANRNKIMLIGIMSKKDSILYKASDIKLFIPEVLEAGLGIVPTSSTINQLSIGDALAVATLNKKNISKKTWQHFKKIEVSEEKKDELSRGEKNLNLYDFWLFYFRQYWKNK